MEDQQGSELTNPNVGISKMKKTSRFGSQPVQAVCRPHSMAKLMREDHGVKGFHEESAANQ